jgi:antitoxin (DNA-binding transcriptional repressor) of toxin-antitoxin stability system
MVNNIMQLTASQLQSHHKALIDALKRGESVEITYHGQLLGVVHPAKASSTIQEQENAMADFFGMHCDLDIAGVEDELRYIRKGRRNTLRDI